MKPRTVCHYCRDFIDSTETPGFKKIYLSTQSAILIPPTIVQKNHTSILLKIKISVTLHWDISSTYFVLFKIIQFIHLSYKKKKKKRNL